MLKMEHEYDQFGGTFLPESLIAANLQLKDAWKQVKSDPKFLGEFKSLLHHYAGRPTPITEAKNLTAKLQGPKIFLKREDLLHTGAHKINNALGQCLLAKYMGKNKIIAETGAGQHGVATAAACAYLGLACTIFMGAKDVERQSPNVARIKMLGATLKSVSNGAGSLKDAVNEALREWSQHFDDTHYCLGSALGPDPYPNMVAQFQSIIGEECKKQFNGKPDLIIACIGGGSNAIGIFSEFLSDDSVQLVGVEAGGHGIQSGEHAARFLSPTKGVLHGCYTYLLQNEFGQIASTSSISAGLDYPAVGPQHAQLFLNKRVKYVSVSDTEAIGAITMLAKTEGIICALESAHAVAYLIKIAPTLSPESSVLINLSGRGDKDLPVLMAGGFI